MERREGFPFAWSCRRSGNCCAIPGGVVRVDAAEVRAIAAFLGLDEAAFRSRFVQPDGERLKDGLGNRCVFLQEGAPAACSIHPVRPGKCASFPFWPELLTDPALAARVRRTCPGIVDDGPPGA